MGCISSKKKPQKQKNDQNKVQRSRQSVPDIPKIQENMRLLTTPDTKTEIKKIKPTHNQIIDKSTFAELFSQEHQLVYRNRKFISDYFITTEKIVNKGLNGKAYIVEHKTTGIKRFAKIARSSLKEQQLLQLTERIQELKKLDHPNLVRIYDFYADDKHIYIVEELCQGGELLERLESEIKGTEKVHVAFIFQQILSALSYLHNQKIIHKNIKSSNILLSSEKKFLVKLIGLETFSELFLQKDKEDISYNAPETFNKDYQWNYAADIWSAGVILYELMIGQHPFKDEETTKSIDIEKNIKKSCFNNVEKFNALRDDVKSILTDMLDQNPKNRPTARTCLKYSFVKQARRFSIKINSVLTRLQQIQQKNELKLIFLSLMIEYLLTKEDRDKLSEVFYKIDTNNDGKITKQELLLQMQIENDKDIAKKEVDRIFECLDFNQNQALDFNEFLVASCNQKQFLTEENLTQFFKKLDKNHSNSISINEFKQLFYNTQLKQEDWENVVRQADEDQNNKISYKEFVQLMTGNS